MDRVWIKDSFYTQYGKLCEINAKMPVKTGLQLSDGLCEFFDLLRCGFVGSSSFRNFIKGMHYGRIVSFAEFFTDFFISGIGKLTTEIHCNLSRVGNGCRALLPFDIVGFDLKIFGCSLLDQFDTDDLNAIFRNEIFQGFHR